MLHEILNAQKKKLGLDLDSIVEKSGVPKGTVSKIMAGTTPNPSIENVKAIAYALGLTLSDLDDQMFSKSLSDEEQSLLTAFRTLDAPGKSTVLAVIETQQQRIKEYGVSVKKSSTRKVPVYHADLNGAVEASFFAKQERLELEREKNLSPDAP